MKELITYKWSASLYYDGNEVFTYSNSSINFKEFEKSVLDFFENVKLGEICYFNYSESDFYKNVLKCVEYYTFVDDLFHSDAVLILTFKKIYDETKKVKSRAKENEKFTDWVDKFYIKDIKGKQIGFTDYFVFDKQAKGYIKTLKIHSNYDYSNFFKRAFIDNRFVLQEVSLNPASKSFYIGKFNQEFIKSLIEKSK